MNPWDETDIWKNESQYLTWLRGNLRKSLWQHYPPKISFKNDRCIEVTDDIRSNFNLHKSCKYTAACEFCEDYFPKSKLEVDHKIGCGELTMDNKSVWIDRLLCKQKDMRLLCKPCHKIHTYAERMNITFEEASLEKKIIKFTTKMSVANQKKILEKYNLPFNNAKARRESARIYILDHSPKSDGE